MTSSFRSLADEVIGGGSVEGLGLQCEASAPSQGSCIHSFSLSPLFVFLSHLWYAGPRASDQKWDLVFFYLTPDLHSCCIQQNSGSTFIARRREWRSRLWRWLGRTPSCQSWILQPLRRVRDVLDEDSETRERLFWAGIGKDGMRTQK